MQRTNNPDNSIFGSGSVEPRVGIINPVALGWITSSVLKISMKG